MFHRLALCALLFTIFPSGAPVPLASTVSFPALRTRASNSIVALGVAGEMDAWSSSATHLAVDVTGYFSP